MNEDAFLVSKGALSLKEFLHWSGLGRTKALEEIAAQHLHAVKVGRRLLIPVESAKAWLAAQPRAQLSLGRIQSATTPQVVQSSSTR